MLFLLVGLRFYFWRHTAVDVYHNFEQSHFDFFLLLLTVGLISSAGYLVNDIFDINVDKVNKPEKRLAYSSSILWGIYTVMNILAILLALYITESRLTQVILYGTIVLLFFYSFFLQKLPLLGNIVVAILAGFLPLLYYSFDSMQVDYSMVVMLSNHGMILDWKLIPVTFLYSFLGFGITLLRELVKDIEDIKGDKNSNYKTFPVLIGVKGSQILFYVLAFLFIVCLLYLNHSIINNFLFDVVYYYLLTFIFLSISIFQVYKANFSKASLFLKLTLFSGVLILFIL